LSSSFARKFLASRRSQARPTKKIISAFQQLADFPGQRLRIFFQPEAAAANYLFRAAFSRRTSRAKENPRISAGAVF